VIGGGREVLPCTLVADVVESLLPVIVKLGIATAEEIAVETLAERLRDDVSASGGVVLTPELVGAWSRV
jgi:hypothetical protein